MLFFFVFFFFIFSPERIRIYFYVSFALVLIYLLNFVFSSRRPVLNLGVWMPADYHMPPPGVEMVGRFSTGRFGWFMPKKLINYLSDDGSSPIIPYTVFKNNKANEFNRFYFDDRLLKQL